MADTLHDFFVGLGFKLDTASQNKAEAAVKRTEDKVTKVSAEASKKRQKIEADDHKRSAGQRALALKREEELQAKSLKGLQSYTIKAASFATKAFATIEASALGVVYAVDRAAKSFERLNYTSRLSGSSASKISAFGYAAGQLGGNKEEAEAQLTDFGQRMKMYRSAYEARLKAMQIATRNKDGSARDNSEIAADIGTWMRKESGKGQFGYARALSWGKSFGFDGANAQAMMRPEFGGMVRQYGSDQGRIGANIDEASKSGTAFEQSMRRLLEVLEQIGTKINGVLFVKLKPLLDQLSAWFLQNGEKIADIVGRLADDLVKLATAIGQQLASADWKTILGNIEAFAKSVGNLLGKLGGDAGLVAKIGALVVALGLLSRLAMPPWALALLGVGAAAKAGMDYLDRDNPSTDSWEGAKRHSHDGWFGSGKGGRKGLFRRGKDGPPGVDYNAKTMSEAMGLSKSEYDAFREGVTDIEGKAYNRMGGAGGRYAGRYQMGPAEITETARRLGVARPTNEQFLNDPAMQEKFFENYTLDHYHTLMQNPKFAAMSKKQKLQILGYAHNQGTGSPRRGGGAWSYLETGRAGSDGWGTSGTAYFKPIGERFDRTQVQKTPPMLKARPLVPSGAPPLSDPTKLQGADGKPVVLAPQHTSMRGDTNINNSPTFHIAGGDTRQSLEAARLTASRGQQDLLRNVQGALA